MKRIWSSRLPMPHFAALRIVIIYLVTGLLWIFFSDYLLQLLVSSEAAYAQYSRYKGAAFIGLTAAMLYWLVAKSFASQLAAKHSLTVSEDRWKFALEGAGDGVWDWDMVTDKVFRSTRWKEIYGYTNNELEETSAAGRALVHPDDLVQQMADTQDYLRGVNDLYVSEFRLLCKDGTWKWTLSRGMVISRSADGKPLRMIGTHTDISVRKQAEKQLYELAHFDQVTRLPNRLLFLDRLQQILNHSQRQRQPFTLMFLDLDRFKEVNDTLGHDIGDKLLKEVGDRLMKCVRVDDTVARMGGDEFTVILNNVALQLNSARIAKNILQQLAEPFYLGEHAVHISVSIGISVYPDDGADAESLLKNADLAMYIAKQHGRNRYHYFNAISHSQATVEMLQ